MGQDIAYLNLEKALEELSLHGDVVFDNWFPKIR